MPTIKSEIRKSYLSDKYVIITPGRAARPRDIKEQTIIRRTKSCPFCSENIDDANILQKTEKSDGSWQVLAIKNIFPAVTLDNKKAYGEQEVIIETPAHSKELAHLGNNEIEMVLKMHASRTQKLMKNKKLEYILCFKNQGSKAGASIVHAHSQIFATSILPPEIHDELNKAEAYQTKHHSCAYCDIIKKEAKSKRLIYSDAEIIAIAPFASEYHYEAWIFTKRHLDNITKLNDKEFKSLSTALKLVLGKLDKLDMAFNFFLHQVVSERKQHFYIKIQPRDSVWAGIELGSGMVINSVPPEEAARYYRK